MLAEYLQLQFQLLHQALDHRQAEAAAAESLSLPPLPRRNGSKIDSCSSCAMPGPVSITLKIMPCLFPSAVPLRHDAFNSTLPSLV